MGVKIILSIIMLTPFYKVAGAGVEPADLGLWGLTLTANSLHRVASPFGRIRISTKRGLKPLHLPIVLRKDKKF